MRKILKIGISVLGILLLAAAIWLYNPLPQNPRAEQLAKAAQNYDVEIIRDNWGVPHIVGERDADVSFGLAYAHAEDDFETIQETVAVSRGALASYRGKEAAVTDYIVSLLGVWDTVDQRYEHDVPDDVKAIARAYAAGLNLYASRHLDKTWQGLAPFKEQDVVAGFVFKTPFFYGLDKVLLDLVDDERKLEIALDPEGVKASWMVRPQSSVELGSNAIAINAARSGDNTTRLLINSHQPMTGPVAWYEAHLISGEGLDISGGLFPGTPLVLHGYNRNLAWANTVNHIDLADTYALEINPDNDSEYKLDDEWLQFEESEVIIPVKLFGPFRYRAKRALLKSAHGPVIQNKQGSFALRYAGMGEVRQLEQYYRLNQAQDLKGFLNAMRMNALPSINYVYADKEDNIGFVHNAQYPMRNDAWQWENDLPGDRSDLIWQGYHPFSSVPQLFNPQSGVLFNANNTPYSATDGPDNLSKDDFPQSMGLAENQTNRSRRMIALISSYPTLGKDDLLTIKFDTFYAKDSNYYQIIQTFLKVDVNGKTDLLKAQELLSKWDGDTAKESRQAALAILLLRSIYRSEAPDDHSPERLITAAQWASDYLQKNHARIDPEWGEVNRLIRGDVNLPIDGGPDILRAIYSFGLDEGEPAYATHGDTWMALVEWNESGELSVDTLHQFGSATLDKSSSHYSDQAPLFVNKQWRKSLMDINEIRASAERSYRP